MATPDKTLRAELDLLRSLARRRRAESLKLARERMMAARRRPIPAEVVPLPTPTPVVEKPSRPHRNAA